jgi:prepilin-type N-terminal cleavage/methylation domain-containing protein
MRRAADRRRRAGTTLLELMVALALAGVLLLGLLLFVDRASGAGIVLARNAARVDSEANGDRLLRALVARAQPSADSLRMFVGEPDRASFDTWCDRPAGWLERCRVTLMLVQHQERTVIVAMLSTGETHPVRTLRGRGVIRYFGRGADDQAGWLTVWGRSIRLPVALGVVTERDTVVLRTGEQP